MNDALLLAIDQGTHSTRALVFDAQGRAVAHASRPVTLQRFSPHKAEQSPVEILGSLQQVLQSVLDNPLVDRSRIQAAGLATQRSSVIAWDRTSGTPLSPVLSWQDRRSAEAMERLAAQATLIREASGLQLSPHYGAGKLQWLLSRLPAVAEAQAAGTLVMGPLASYLLHHLTDNPAELVDHANASRTLLWNLRTRDWDERLLQLFSIPPAVLPECRPICADYGTTLNGAIPLQAVNGDQTAALHAQGSPRDDTVVVNIGTGAFVLLPVPDPGARPDGLLAGISMSQDHATNYYVEGTVNGAAAALDWAQQRFDVPDLEDKLPDWLATYDAPGLFLNTVNGIGAPWWRSGPEPHFLDPAVSAPEAMVAVIESIIFLIQANVTLLCELNPAVSRIQISGGLARLDGLCQKLANLSGLSVHRPVQIEATARGIAWQAAGCPQDWPPTGTGETFTPLTDAGLRQRHAQFLEVLQRALAGESPVPDSTR